MNEKSKISATIRAAAKLKQPAVRQPQQSAIKQIVQVMLAKKLHHYRGDLVINDPRSD
jgi:hypothetical protein